MKTFTDLPLLPEIQKSLQTLGFTTPTEIQAKIIPSLLNTEHDVHAQAQTGTGKTLAFGIPLLHAINPSVRAVQGLVIAPTRELVMQTYESLRAVSRNTGIVIEPIYGGMSIMQQISAIRHGAHIIIGTPGRLNDHLRRRTLSLKGLKVFVLDEADIMLDMGFKEEVDDILAQAPSNRQIWLFSATVGDGIRKLIKSHMHDVLSVKSEEINKASTQVKQYFCIISMAKRVSALARFIEAAPEFYSIVFCRTKALASDVAEELVSLGFKANCLHGDMKQTLRNHVIKGFKNKDFNILVATDVAARGIDVSDLTHVINFSIPDEPDAYIHRIGRTGRAGKEGIAITLISPSEMGRVKRFEKAIRSTLEEIEVPPCGSIVTAKMSAVSDFIEHSKNPNAQYSQIHQQIKDLVTSFTEEEIRNAFALSLEEKFFKGFIQEDLGCRVQKNPAVPQDICITLGKEAGFTEEIVRNYLYVTCKLTPQDIRKINVQKSKTFISLPENLLADCFAKTRTTPISTKNHRTYLAEGLKEGRPSHAKQNRGFERSDDRSSGRRDRFRGRRGDRR